MMLTSVHGHMIIICIGIPIVSGVIYNLRKVYVRRLILTGIDKVRSEAKALLRMAKLRQMIKNTSFANEKDIILIGLVNLHMLECQNLNCPCKNENDLYDVNTESFIKRDSKYMHNPVFLKYLVKEKYGILIDKFINSSLLHINFATYLFEEMKNVHSALIQLGMAEKKKPSLQQQLTIYRKKFEVAEYIKATSKETKAEYKHLTDLITFEELFNKCKAAIEKVVSLQIEFWAQVSNQIPDLNLMHVLRKKIFEVSRKADAHWNALCEINPNYPKALLTYGQYMIEIRNDNQVGNKLIERY